MLSSNTNKILLTNIVLGGARGKRCGFRCLCVAISTIDLLLESGCGVYAKPKATNDDKQCFGIETPLSLSIQMLTICS